MDTTHPESQNIFQEEQSQYFAYHFHWLILCSLPDVVMHVGSSSQALSLPPHTQSSAG